MSLFALKEQVIECYMILTYFIFLGMGYKGADGDEAVAQQKDFDALLATLSQKTQSPEGKASPIEASKNLNSPASLELRSQKSRARVQ